MPVDAVPGADVDWTRCSSTARCSTTWASPTPPSSWPFAGSPSAGRHRPGTAIVHGDFRLGNLIVDGDGLAAVLDWELAHLGDPMEDLGWLCVKAWRFGGRGPVAGLGGYEELFAAYSEASGRPVDPAVVRWWEVLGTLKWGIMCIMQANAHLTGASRSHELAAIGRRVSRTSTTCCPPGVRAASAT